MLHVAKNQYWTSFLLRNPHREIIEEAFLHYGQKASQIGIWSWIERNYGRLH